LHHPYLPGSITIEEEVVEEGLSEADKAEDQRALQRWLQNYLDDYDTESDEDQEEGTSSEEEGEEAVGDQEGASVEVVGEQAESSSVHRCHVSEPDSAKQTEISYTDGWKPVVKTALPRPTEEDGDLLISKVSAWEGNKAGFDQGGDYETMHERELVRHCLWMLQGVQSSLFEIEEAPAAAASRRPRPNRVHFVMGRRVVLSHVSPGSLDGILRHIAKLGDDVVWLERAMLALQSCRHAGNTMHAFAAHSSKLLSEFKASVAELARPGVITPGAVPPAASLLALTTWMSEHNSQIKLLKRVMEESELDMLSPARLSKEEVPAVVAKLLDAIFGITSNAATLGKGGDYRDALAMFVVTVRPYVQSLEAWIQRGAVSDPYGEFMVHEDSSVAEGTVHQWRLGWTLRRKQEAIEGGEEEFDMAADENNRGNESGDDDLLGGEVCADVLPSFLIPLAKDLLSTGKSAHLLSMMDRIPANECVVAASASVEQALSEVAKAKVVEEKQRAKADLLTEAAQEAKATAKGMAKEARGLLTRARMLDAESRSLASGVPLELVLLTLPTPIMPEEEEEDGEESLAAPRGWLRGPSALVPVEEAATEEVEEDMASLEKLSAEGRASAITRKRNSADRLMIEALDKSHAARLFGLDQKAAAIQTADKADKDLVVASRAVRAARQHEIFCRDRLASAERDAPVPIQSIFEMFCRALEGSKEEASPQEVAPRPQMATDETMLVPGHPGDAPRSAWGKAAPPRKDLILGGEPDFRLSQWSSQAASVAMMTNDNRSAWSSLGAVTAGAYTEAVALHNKGLAEGTVLETGAVLETPSSPMEVVLDHTLLSRLRATSRLTNAAVLRVLMNEAHLMQHLATLRTFFFMTKGDVLHDFTSVLFWRMELKQHLGNSVDLNQQLREAVNSLEGYGAQNIRCDFDEAIAVSIEHKDKYGIRALDPLQLAYIAEWPVNLVISPVAVAQYNKVFSFLIQIKRAQFLLNRIVDTSKDAPAQIGHGFQLFQAELRHFVNNLHLYVMTRVLHSTWMEHKTRIAASANVDELCARHANYIDATLAMCLLSSKGSTGRVLEFIRGILSLVLEFTGVYRKYLESVEKLIERRALDVQRVSHDPYDSSEEEAEEKSFKHGGSAAAAAAERDEYVVVLGSIKSRFKQQHRLLMMILQKKTEKGRFPHLEDMLTRLNYNRFYDMS